MASPAVSVGTYWRLVSSNRNYRRLWLAQIVSEMGDWLYVVAIYTLLLRLTGTAKSVAIAVVLQVLPQFFVAPAAGIVNDRASRRRVMIAADLARAAIVLLMLVAARTQVVGLIYVLLFLETVMWAFFEPGRSAVVPNIASGEELAAANALSSMTWSLTLALGAGLGGVVAALFGHDTVFVLNSLSFVASAALLRGMKFEERHLEGLKPLRARDLVDFSPLVEGVRYVAGDKRLVLLLLAKAGLGVFATHWVILPIFGERIFPVKLAGLDPRRGAMLGMSALMSSRGVGALVGPFCGGLWSGQNRERLRVGILAGFLAGAAGFAGLSVAPSLGLAVLTVIVAHSGSSVGWVYTTTLLQFHTEDRFRGRVFSADFAFLVLSMSIASFLAGQLVDAGVPVRAVALWTGVLALAPAAAWGFGIWKWKEAECRPVPASEERRP
jgi:predicted MFS family arabinose efflux permease